MKDSQKRTLIIAAAVIAIIIIILLLMRACRGCEEYRIDDEEEPDTETTEALLEDIDIPPPTSDNFETGMEELSAFVLASTSFSCAVLENPEIAQDAEMAEELARNSYANYGFPVDDTPTMMQILQKYENIEEVTQIIQRNVENCG